jgi:hypothetical protein
MSQVRISSPTAAAAFFLVELLGERGVTARSLADGTWEVALSLNGSGPENLPSVLSTTRGWLRSCGLPGTQVTVGAETHSLAAEPSAAASTLT